MPLFKDAGKALADVIPGLGRLTFDPNLGTIFITSGTGLVGYRVALKLLEAGHKSVKVGIYHGDRQTDDQNETIAEKVSKKLEEKGAEIVDFDWKNPATYEAALTGTKTIFCTITHIPGWDEVFPEFLVSCKTHKIEHFIKVSFFRSGDVNNPYRVNVPFVKFHGGCDDILEQAPADSRISYTILCASHLMATPLLNQGKTLSKEHKFVTASYGMGVNYISPNDVADAAIVVLLDRKTHRNKVYNLSGPRPAITDAEVAKLLTDFYGTKIEHIQLGYHDFEAHVKSRGLPDWLVKDSAALERMKASGVDELPSSYTKDLEKLIGRSPETFRHYLQNRAAMRPGLTFP